MMTLFHYVRVQFFVAYATLFFSKEKLRRIAVNGGNHPLVIFHTARWVRLWWLSVLGVIIWVATLTPLLNLIIFGSETTFFSSITHKDEIIYCNEWSFNLWTILIVGMVTGKLLQFAEVYSANRIQFFRRFLRKDFTKKPKSIGDEVKFID